MENYALNPGKPAIWLPPKLLLIMKLIIVIMTTFLMQASAVGYAQKVTLNETAAPLGNIINKIRLQTGYDFIFNAKVVGNAKKVTINLKNVELEEALKIVFRDQDLSYSLKDKFIVIEAARPSFIDNLRAVFVNIDVRGRIVDSATGNPLPGATVSVKGRRQLVRTGTDGTFLLQNVAEDATVLITYTGYTTKEIPAAKELGTVPMEIAIGKLEEVAVTVNTGYQRIKPEQSTGAVAQITTKEFESRVSTNFLDGLVNRLPGLMINNTVNFTSTTPGSGATSSRSLFSIRGISTMSANQSPLIVVDGYPTELTLDMIDPNEIASVTILKDAAAATVYGVRASNGVIVIERKQARPGAAQFNFRSTVGLTPKENYSRYRWDSNASAINANYLRERQALNITPNTWASLFTPSEGATGRTLPFYIQAQLAAGIISPQQAESSFAELANYDNIKDYSRLFNRMAATQTHTFNVSGGVPAALYYITANYTGNRQNEILNDNNRLLLTGRTTIKLAKRLKLELTTEYQELRNNGAPVPGPAAFGAYERYTDVNGNPAPIISQSNAPVYNTYIMSQGLLDNNYYPLVDANSISDKTRTLNNKTIANFTYDLGKGFDLLFGGVYETSRSEISHLANEGSSEVNGWVNNYTVTEETFKRNVPNGAFLRQQNTSSTGYTARAQLNYNKRVGNHSFNGIAGAEMRSVLGKGNLASYFGYNDQSLLQQPVDYAAIFTGDAAVKGTLITQNPLGELTNFFNQTYSEDRYLSAFSNLVYSFKDTYSLSGSIRIDQSNLFGTDEKYKYKPLWSLGAAWNIHKERFLNNLKWLDQLKLRSAFGFNGNVAKLSLPQVIAVAQNNTSNTPTLNSLILASNANSGLRWETTENFNLGLDFGIFRNISGSFDFYTKKTTDVMGNATIDPTLGASTALINYATIRNNGLEFSLRADWIANKRFNWNTGIVIGKNNSKVLDVFRVGTYDPQALDALGYVSGYPVGAMFSYNTAGLNNEGHPIILDPNGTQYVVNTNSSSSVLAKAMSSKESGLVQYSGTTLPSINAGLSNRVDVGNFYFFAMINYYGGFKVRVPRPTPADNRPFEGANNYWRAGGDELKTDIPRLTDLTNAYSSWAYRYNRNYVVHGDYLTIGDLTVSYRLNDVSFIKKAGFKNFEIKGQVSNLYTVGFNRYNFSMGTGSYAKPYVTPTYTLGLFTNF